MPNHFYPPIGKCIYCGTTVIPKGAKRLGNEHIFPFALGGNLILRQASCNDCAGIINKEIETPVLFKEWIYLRIKRSFPTQNKKKKKPRNSHITLSCNDGSPLRVPIKDYSAPVPLYKFKEARIFKDTPRTDNNLHWTMEILTDHDSEMEMRKKYPQWNGQHSFITRPYEFARLLTKIAYSRAVAEYGLEGFKALVLDIILGRSDDYFYTVGGSFEIHPAITGGDHIADLRIFIHSQTRALLIVEVRLFSQIRTPSYHVVVGEIDLQNPQHIAVFNKHHLNGKINIQNTI